MIEITPAIQIDEQEIEYNFIRSTGPGGQNVNKVSSAVQLRFNVGESPSIPGEVKQRLSRLAGRRMSAGGIMTIVARHYRTQEQNRQAALARLVHLIQQAAQPPRPRHKTHPSRAAIQRRLEVKRKRGEIKRMRHDSGNVD
jgi:ribosome-associated protein